MPSINDFYGQVVAMNATLVQLDTDLATETAATHSVQASVDAVNTTLNAQLATLEGLVAALARISAYEAEALFHLSQQNETVICLLEKINKQSCLTLTEAAQQTKLQTETNAGVNWLVELEKTVHAAAALELARLSTLRQQLLECCPEKIEPPACVPEPCPRPEGQLAPPPGQCRGRDSAERSRAGRGPGRAVALGPALRLFGSLVGGML